MEMGKGRVRVLFAGVRPVANVRLGGMLREDYEATIGNYVYYVGLVAVWGT
jgi:hypothetical protein